MLLKLLLFYFYKITKKRNKPKLFAKYLFAETIILLKTFLWNAKHTPLQGSAEGH